MTDTPTSSIPVAWLRRAPAGYKMPIWRWILLPASALMLRHYGGVWVSGELLLTEAQLRFRQSTWTKASRPDAQDWTLELADITQAKLTKGLASETLEVFHRGGTEKLMAARPGEFVAQLEAALASSHRTAATG